MSVLVKDMKMPKGCHSGCPLTDSDAFTCEITGRDIVWDEENTLTCRPSWCPLVEVSSDEEMQKYNAYQDEMGGVEAQTMIEAEE